MDSLKQYQSYKKQRQEMHELGIMSYEYMEQEGESWEMVTNMNDMTLLIKNMQYESVAEFEEKTGAKAVELIGKWWQLMGDRGGDRVFVKD